MTPLSTTPLSTAGGTATAGVEPGLSVAAASVALRHLGPGAFAVAEAPNGPRFPNGFVPNDEAAGEPPVTCGAGVSGPLASAIVARRWWEPAVLVAPFEERRVHRFLAGIEAIELPHEPEAGIGWGPGLTPAGDDVVVGMLVTYRAIGADEEAAGLAAACADGDTSPFSRSLLDHAARGEAARPLLELLRALAGFGDLSQSLSRLTGFGATSGYHLIEGVRRIVAAMPSAGRR
ncbi:MAG: DUF2877 domain-containing protein [Acidimicrobiales bacterium]